MKSKMFKNSLIKNRKLKITDQAKKIRRKYISKIFQKRSKNPNFLESCIIFIKNFDFLNLSQNIQNINFVPQKVIL